ncbi:hypothetical protein L6452_08977 [Arctium lappa]|uniref:Uncharacterized protein n=1 Tax=Arctium lappa TaxID=4217 RepID=A0ACB9DIQ0_ARCLA|nr:hypothetical protein L6452_08977 [Arctium lappa]
MGVVEEEEGTDDSTPIHNFDLNLDLDENGDTPPVGSSTDRHTICAPPVGPSANPTLEMKAGEYPGWSMVDVENMAIDRMKLANLNNRVDEEDEDYDEEE